MKSKQASFIVILIIIVLCIVVLLRTSFSQYSEQKILHNASLQREINNKQIAKLDTISIGLLEAENNFRMYTSLWEKQYFIKYSKNIQHISVLLESFSQNNVNGISTEIAGDLEKKKQQISLYTEIKRLTDSLMSVNMKIDTTKALPVINFTNSLPKYILKRTVRTEEVKPDTVVKKKLKFFQRLKSAILNKDAKKDSLRTSKIESFYEETPEKAQENINKQTRQIEQFYKNLFEKQRGNHLNLTKRERTILKLNEQIFQNIKLMFKEFRTGEREIEELRKIALNEKAQHSLQVIDRAGKINFIINIVSFLIIILLMIKLYKAYTRIVKAGKLAEEQVIFKSKFFTSLSHEMRTPLNAILGVTEQLKSTALNQEQSEMANLLENSSSMLLSAVNEVLDFSRLETGKLSLSKTPFYYKNILNNIVATTSVLANQKGLELTLNQQDVPDLLVTGDPYRLKQIIINLIANAIKFTDKGKVTVKVSVKNIDSEQIRLSVLITDTGIGIAEKDLPYIFDEFSQIIHHKRVDWQKGSGLGLPICKRLVNLHQGKITVESTVGKGTSFQVELPYALAQQENRDLSDHKAITLQTDLFKKINLLVVDDVKMNLLVIKMIFNKQGINFDSTTNGKEALELFEKNTYDLVLTDIEMPGMDGIELTKKIRAHHNPKKSHTPIIAITGQISPESHTNYISSGLNDYLVKPYKENELLEKIIDYLS